jgi:thiol-disulfide isomerase/thioredoxin
MPSTVPPTADDHPPGEAAAEPGRRRGLGIGPVGLLLITLFSASVAVGFVWLVFSLATDEPEAVDLQDALDQLDTGPPVPEGASPAQIGDPAPDVRLDFLTPDGLGGQATLDQVLQQSGTPLVLNFWSSTCAPCLQEMPDFERVAAANQGTAQIIGVDVQDTEQAGLEMISRTGVTYQNARDPKGEIFAVFGGTALPRTVVVDVDGTVLDTHTGALDAGELVDLLRRNGIEATA